MNLRVLRTRVQIPKDFVYLFQIFFKLLPNKNPEKRKERTSVSENSLKAFFRGSCPTFGSSSSFLFKNRIIGKNSVHCFE